jgi:hypothetical protein
MTARSHEIKEIKQELKEIREVREEDNRQTGGHDGRSHPSDR